MTIETMWRCPLKVIEETTGEVLYEGTGARAVVGEDSPFCGYVIWRPHGSVRLPSGGEWSEDCGISGYTLIHKGESKQTPMPITARNLAKMTGFAVGKTTNKLLLWEKSDDLLRELKQRGFLKERFGIRCPKCNLLLKIACEDDKINETEYCTSCDENIEVTFGCIDTVYASTDTVFIKPSCNAEANKRDAASSMNGIDCESEALNSDKQFRNSGKSGTTRSQTDADTAQSVRKE